MEEYERLDDLICANRPPLWDIRLPFKQRVQQILRVREEIRAEWAAACEDDDIGSIDTGVLLGALNLITDLLKGAGVPVPDDDEE